MARRADGTWLPLPDYLNDLNAMHEAVEKHFNEGQKQAFAWALYQNLFPGQLIIQATAAQRAEAFLKTINKWTTD